MLKSYSSPTNSLEKPIAILLDTDNTLYNYEPANKAALNASFLKIHTSLGISKSDFYLYYSLARDQVKSQLGRTASSHSRLLYFQKMFELLGLNSQLLFSLDLEQTFWRTFLANAPLFDGLLDFLNQSRNYDIKLGIVTDLTSHIQLRKLTYFNLENFFDAVVCSEEVGADKPDIRNFEMCFSKLNLSNTNPVWMIGDDPLSDIHGGNQAQCVTFQKLHDKFTVKPHIATPDFAFNSYGELSKLILKLFKT